MNLEEIIALKPEQGFFERFLELTWSTGIGTVALALIIFGMAYVILAFLVLPEDNKNHKGTIILSLGVSLLVTLIITSSLIKDELTVEWTEKHVVPYVESLEPIRTKMNDYEIFEKPYKNTVIFVHDGEFITRKDVKVAGDLEPGEEPYLTYIYVPKELEEHYESGFFGFGSFQKVTIHLPKDYKF